MESEQGHHAADLTAHASPNTNEGLHGLNSMGTANGDNGVNGKTSNVVFERLPRPIIERILQMVDADTFSSLAVLNRTWHAVSTNADLYAQTLLQCPTISSGGRATYDSLRQTGVDHMKRLLAREGKQDLWKSFTHQKTTFRLVAPSTATSTALPRGDVLKFKFSSSRRLMLAVSSSRIFVVDPRSFVPKVVRELTIRRRPYAADVSADGSVLALLTTAQKLNVYRLTDSSPHHAEAIQLQSSAKAIALSPDCSLLAAAGDAGVEIVSLHARRSQLRTRIVRSQPMDSLTFSADGMVVIGTQTKLDEPITIAIHASPRHEFESEEAFDQGLDQLWITQPLFPNTFRQCGYAVPLPNMDYGDVDKAFALDAPADAFGTLDLQGLRFTSSTESRGPLLRPSKSKGWTLPSVDDSGDLIAIADSRLRLHLVPAADPRRTRQLQLAEALFSVCWIPDSEHHVQRLIGVLPPERPQHPNQPLYEAFPVDVGRLAAFDFGCPLSDGGAAEMTIQLETGNPEPLDDSSWGLEVDLQLTANADPRAGSSNVLKSAPPLGRSVTQARRESRSSQAQLRQTSNASTSNASESNESTGAPGVGSLSLEDAQFSFEDYTPAQPRNRTTLQRAATAAATNRRPRHEADPAEPPIRHQSGRWEVPDESDADNWIPPPPPYHVQTEPSPQPHVPHRGYVAPTSPLQRSLTTSAIEGPRSAPAPLVPLVPSLPPVDQRSPAPPVPALPPMRHDSGNSPVLQSPAVAGPAIETEPVLPETTITPSDIPSPSSELQGRPSNVSAAESSIAPSANSEESPTVEEPGVNRSDPPSLQTTQRSSTEPQRVSEGDFEPAILHSHDESRFPFRQRHLGPPVPPKRPLTPPLQTTSTPVESARETSTPQSATTPQQPQSPQSSTHSGSPVSPEEVSLQAHRRRNTLRRYRLSLQTSYDRDVVAPNITPSNPLPKSRPLSGLAVQVPRSSSASQLGGHPSRLLPAAPLPNADFVPPSADQLARLSRRYTVRAENDLPSPVYSVPSAAAGARRSLPPDAIDESGQSSAVRYSRGLSISSATAGGQEELPWQTSPADRRFFATMATISSNVSAARSEPVLPPADHVLAGRPGEPAAGQRRNFTSPLASTSSGGPEDAVNDRKPQRWGWQKRISFSDSRSYRAWREPDAAGSHHVPAGIQGHSPLDSPHVPSPLGNVTPAPPPEQDPEPLPKSRGGGGLGRLKTVLDRGSGRASRHHAAPPPAAAERKGKGLKCAVM